MQSGPSLGRFKEFAKHLVEIHNVLGSKRATLLLPGAFDERTTERILKGTVRRPKKETIKEIANGISTAFENNWTPEQKIQARALFKEYGSSLRKVPSAEDIQAYLWKLLPPVLSEEKAGTILANEIEETDFAFKIPKPIPGPADEFVDRKELQTARKFFSSPNPVRLVLYGGVGQGRRQIARKLAKEFKRRFSHGIVELDLESSDALAGTQSVLADIILEFSGKRLVDNVSQLQRELKKLLEGKAALIILYNAVDAEQLVSLLPPDSCSLIVTSRNRLAVPDFQQIHVGSLDQKTACSLARKFAGHRLNFDEYAEELVELCGRNPFAIYIAAKTIVENESLPLATFVRRLRIARMKILEPYQKALELSYSALSKHPKKRTIWRRLSVFTTYFDHNMAASIVSSKSIKAEEVLEILESLRKDRLVDYDEAKGFSLHVLVQAFLIEKLAKEEKAQLEGGNAYYFAGALALSTRHFLRTGRIQEAGFLFIKRYYRFYAACHWAFKHDSKLYAVLIKENFLFLAAILFDAGETGDLSSWVRFDCFNYPLTSSGDPYLDAVRYFLLGCTHIVNGSDDCQELFQAAQGCLEEVQGDDSHLRDQLLTLINLRLAEFWRRFADYERTRSLYRECWLGLRNHPEPVVWVAGLCAYSKFLHDIKRPRLARRCEDEIRRLVKERLEPSWQSLVESAIAPPKNRKNRWLTACGEDYYQYFVVPPSEFRKTVESWEPKHDKEFQK